MISGVRSLVTQNIPTGQACTMVARKWAWRIGRCWTMVTVPATTSPLGMKSGTVDDNKLLMVVGETE